MLKRLGFSGAKRLKGFLETSRLTQCSTVNADGQGSSTKGVVYSRMCSSLSQHFDGPSSSGRAAREAEPNGRWQYRKDRQQSAAASSSGISFLQQATGDYELHLRLAALWGMPSELLFERQQTVAKMLGPAGCGTAAHALWLLVRAPQLRHMPESALWASLKQLQRLVSHTEIDRAAVLTAVYKYPWMLEAMSDADTPAATAAAAAQRSRQQPSSTAAAQPSASFSTASTHAAAVEPASWAQELAAVILELQQADYVEHVESGKASRGLRMSPGFAVAAVRTYLAVGEVQQRVSNATSGFANRLLGITPEHSVLPSPTSPADEQDDDGPASSSVAASSKSSSSTSSRQDQHSPAAAAPHKLSQPSAAYACAPSPQQQYPTASATSEVLAALQQHQQQHLLMQQLLVACPHLTVLPPELLLARYERLTSVMSGCAEAANDVLVANPFLLVTYDDVAATHADAQAIRQVYA